MEDQIQTHMSPEYTGEYDDTQTFTSSVEIKTC